MSKPSKASEGSKASEASKAAVDDGVQVAADLLFEAAQRGIACPPVRDLLPDGAVNTGYAVQNLLTARRLAGGARIVGRKVGLTSAAVQAQLGVDSPDFGVLFDDMVRSTRQTISTTTPTALIAPRIEAELAFVLGADLTGEITEASVRAATLQICPALEIVDSRIAGWQISLLDTVADNASSALYVLGENPVPLGDRDLRELRMTMVDGAGTEVSSGTGADCLGDPVLAVLWLARTAADLGHPLRAGEVILSGALGPMVPLAPGSRFTATLSLPGPSDPELIVLGEVTASFAAVPS